MKRLCRWHPDWDEYALVAAGSTITDDVHDKDMAIARPFATTKEGYGYVYINKER